MSQRTTLGAIVALGIALRAAPAAAQSAPPAVSASDEEKAPGEKTGEEEAAPGEAAPAAPEGVPVPTAEAGVDIPKVRTSPQKLWRDIVVVPRKDVLKARRFEIAPYWGMNVNDPVITHFALGADANYFLTDVLWLGIEATKYFSKQEDIDFDVRRTYRMAARVNDLDYGAGLNFGYVPAYGKFTILNQALIHWEGFVTAGVGIVGTTIIPRQVDDPKFSTLNIAPSVGAGGRVWLSRWLSVWFVFRDYIFNDKYEPTDRERIENEFCEGRLMGVTNPAEEQAIREDCAADALDLVKDNADTALINNLMFMVGASFFLPTDFQYTTFR